VNWFAAGSTAAVDARDNTGTNPLTSVGVPIYLLDGVTKIADDNADLWDSLGISKNPVSVDQFLSLKTSSDRVWSGTGTSGIQLFAPLGDAGTILAGDPTAILNTWIAAGFQPSADSHSFYGISQELNAAAVPEPSTFALLGVGAISLIGYRRRNQKQIATTI
jgi:hypothetical protein